VDGLAHGFDRRQLEVRADELGERRRRCAAVGAARRAFDEGPWPRLTHAERAEYLRAFGPARAADFKWWAGTSAKRANQALATVDTEELDGGLLIRAQDRAAFEKPRTPPSGAVDLLPKWDAYTMGLAPDGRDRFAHPDMVGDLYEKSGDGRPVILVDGAAAGVWSVKAGKADAIDVELEPFEKPARKLQAALDERADAVKAFLA
jgi:hypothetical protein